jgi:phosphoglycolate phosphatase-like HAD superfamily hydrolase
MDRDMQQIRHFIWDFDGTLFDTYPVIIKNLRSALAEYGRDCDPVDAMRRMASTGSQSCPYSASALRRFSMITG